MDLSSSSLRTSTYVFGRAGAQLFEVAEPLGHHVFVDIAHGGDLHAFDFVVGLQMIPAAAAQADDGDADAVVGAEDGSGLHGSGDARAGFQKIPPVDFHDLLLLIGFLTLSLVAARAPH